MKDPLLISITLCLIAINFNLIEIAKKETTIIVQPTQEQVNIAAKEMIMSKGSSLMSMADLKELEL